MGTLGNLGAIDAEAGVGTRTAISELDRRLRLLKESFGRIVKNNQIQPVAFSALSANPSAQVTLSSIHGSAVTYMRSDASPALSQAIAPTWTAAHTWTPGSDFTPVTIKGNASQTADILVVESNGGTDHLVVDNSGLVGVSANPDAHVTISDPGGFTPSTLSPWGWWEADDISGPSDSPDVDAYSDNTSIADGVKWQDKSTNNRHLYFHPVGLGNIKYRTLRQNTKPGILFSAAAYAGFGSPTPSNETIPAAWTVFYVYSHTGGSPTPGSSNDAFLSGLDLNNYYLKLPYGDTNTYPTSVENDWAWRNGNPGDTESKFPNMGPPGPGSQDPIVRQVTSYHVHAASKSGSALTAYYDGVTRGTVSGISNAAGTFTIGGIRAYTGSSRREITILEIIIFGSALSESDRRRVDNYLLNKYQISGGGGGTTVYDYIDVKNPLGTTWLSATTNERLGIGVGTSPLAKVDVASLTEQLRLGYSSSHYCSFTQADSGTFTFDITTSGTPLFQFNDPVSFASGLSPTVNIIGTTTPQIKIGYDSSHYFQFSGDSSSNAVIDLISPTAPPDKPALTISCRISDLTSSDEALPWFFSSDRGASPGGIGGFTFKTLKGPTFRNNVHTEWTNASDVVIMQLGDGTAAGLYVAGNFYATDGGIQPDPSYSMGFWGAAPKSRLAHGATGWDGYSAVATKTVNWNSPTPPTFTDFNGVCQALGNLIATLKSIGILAG